MVSLPCCLQSAVSCCKNTKKEQQEQAKNGRRCRCSIWRDRCQLVAVCGSHLRTERNEEPPLSLNRRRRRRRQRFSSLCELLRCCCCCWVGTPRPSCHSYSLQFEPPPPKLPSPSREVGAARVDGDVSRASLGSLPPCASAACAARLAAR